MDKCQDKFCPDCGVIVEPDDIKTFADVRELRERYDAIADEEN